MPVRIANSLQVRYYQHEVPTDYQQRPWAAKVIQNTTAITALACLMYGLYIGLGPFVIYIVCKMVHYVTGSLGLESGLLKPRSSKLR